MTSDFNFTVADVAAHANKSIIEDGAAEIAASTDYYNGLQEKNHDNCNRFLAEPVDEWARVCEMRKNEHLLIKGGRYKDPHEHVSGRMIGKKASTGAHSRRRDI